MTATLVRDTKDGSFHPAGHLEFVSNRQRNQAFAAAFEHLASGKTVLDVGTGSGLQAIYAARAGAQRVIAVERDERIAAVARENIARNERGGIVRPGVICLIVGDALELSKSDLPPVDVLIGELLSTWCVVEPQVPVFRHILAIVDGNPLTIPRRIINFAEGVHTNFGDSEGLVYIPTTYFEFESVRPKAAKRTARVKVSEIVFSKDMETDSRISISLRVTKGGVVNALRLTSVTETCEGVHFNPTDDTMPRMIVPLGREMSVQEGQTLFLIVHFEYGAGWDKFSVERARVF